MKDRCEGCGRTLKLYASKESEASAILEQDGEAECCCGDYDAAGHHINSRCVDCCGPHPALLHGGSGYYLTAPR